MTRRRPRVTIHSCKATVIVGLDADRCALLAIVDPWALTAAGEVAALREGRRTYRMFMGALDPRDQWNIPGHPPTPGLPVLAEHRCHHPTPDHWRAPPPPKPAARPTTEEPPF